MKLYERFADKSFHTSLATTFGIDFDAYENIVLPRLRGAGCRNNIVVADSRMLTHALSGASALPRQAGKLYTISGKGAKGVFHPKLFLQFGRHGGRMIISSANLTASGLAGNLELMGLVDCGDESSGESRLIAQAWAYAQRQLPANQQALKVQIEWLRSRAPWLVRADAAEGPEQLSDGTLAALLTSGRSRGIGQQFVELIDEPVSRLIVISPYWDRDLASLAAIAEQLSAGEISVLIDPDNMVFPKDVATKLPALKLYERGKFREGRFIHAKAIIAQTESADHMLIGSANCTAAALGTQSFVGRNEEVSLYRKLPSGSVLERLDLASLLTKDHQIDPASLEAAVIEDEIPLVELARLSPGQFEIRVDTLIWYPPLAMDTTDCKIELLDESGATFAVNLTYMASSTAEAKRFQFTPREESPAFARLIYPDGQRSSMAVVALIDRLRIAIRETQSRQSENFQYQLDGETDAHLGLFDILDVLEKIDDDGRDVNEPRALHRAASGDDNTLPEQHRKLTYEEFIKGRRPRATGPTVANSSLEGSEISIVRSFLNRILGMHIIDEIELDDEDKVGKNAFNLGDETGDAEGALAAGEEFGNDEEEPKSDQALSDEMEKRKARHKKATKKQIITAIARFHDRIKARREAGILSNHDILRLRALLMVICSAAIPVNAGKKTKLSDLQLLPANGDSDCWPILMGRVINALFGGKNPAIHELIVQSEHDQLPDDIIECWATCYWCLAACLTLPLSKQEGVRISVMLEPLAKKAYLLTLPNQEELFGDDIVTFMERMSMRYSQRLDLDAAKIAEKHKLIIGDLFPGKTMS